MDKERLRELAGLNEAMDPGPWTQQRKSGGWVVVLHDNMDFAGVIGPFHSERAAEEFMQGAGTDVGYEVVQPKNPLDWKQGLQR